MHVFACWSFRLDFFIHYENNFLCTACKTVKLRNMQSHKKIQSLGHRFSQPAQHPISLFPGVAYKIVILYVYAFILLLCYLHYNLAKSQYNQQKQRKGWWRRLMLSENDDDDAWLSRSIWSFSCVHLQHPSILLNDFLRNNLIEKIPVFSLSHLYFFCLQFTTQQ